MKHISQEDIAQELGIAVSTVSRALTGKPGVSAALRERIRAMAQEHNYRPNPFAKSLRFDTPSIIGVIVPDIATHFYSNILKSIERTAQQKGYFSILMTSNEHLDEEKRAVSNLMSLHVEGIIICLSQETKDCSHLKELVERHVPLVLYDRVGDDRMFSTVTIDDANSARDATNYMIERGACRVAYLGGANYLNVVANRKHGYLEALRDHHMKIDPKLVACHEIDYNTGLVDTMELLDLPDPPDAILGMNDTLTFAAMEAIKSRGLRIPQDVQLIGYTDEQHAKYVEPKLTAVRHNTTMIGKRACELLFDQVNGNFQPQHAIVGTHLEIRASTK